MKAGEQGRELSLLEEKTDRGEKPERAEKAEWAAEKADHRDKTDRGLMETLIRQTAQLTQTLEKASIAEYVKFLESPRRLIFANFLAGLARGFGIAVGLTLVGALFLYILGKIAALNLPIIGQFVADIARIVRYELNIKP